jgi:hypothetical protein
LPEGEARSPARRWLAAFLPDAKRSRPIGLHAESEELQRSFRHDRLLQSELEQDDAGGIRSVFDAEPTLRAGYRRHLALLMKLTGPLAMPSIEESTTRLCSVLPPSESAEGRLLKQLFGGASVPSGFQLGPELVARIRDGRLLTRPAASDGWYAYQLHAIAALLDPDSDRLRVGPRYRTQLEETFQALFAMNRETHLKQLELAAAGGCPIVIAPRLTVEPLPDYYSRVADGYRFLREALSELLGEVVLRSTEVERDGVGLWDALVDIEMLFLGAEAASRDELGQSITPSRERDVARARFRAWQRTTSGDAELRSDLRVAAPVWFDVERETVHLCATIGVETRSLRFEYLEPPTVTLFGASTARFADKPTFQSSARLILSPITIECDVRVPPTRDEFRTICDEHGSPGRIKEALEER